EKPLEHASTSALSGLTFVTGLDKERTTLKTVVEAVERTLEIKTVALSLPIGQEGALEGVIDLITGEAYRYAVEGSGKRQKCEIPPAMTEEAESARKAVIECAAEADDQLLEQYLAEGSLSEAEIIQGLKAGTLSRRFFPLLCGSGVKNIGAVELLNAMRSLLPSPVERMAARPVETKTANGGEAASLSLSPTAPFAG